MKQPKVFHWSDWAKTQTRERLVFHAGYPWSSKGLREAAVAELHQRQEGADAKPEPARADEALTLDCPEPAREVPSQRIREAVEHAIEHHEIAYLNGPLRSVLRINMMVGDDGADTIFGDLSRAITAAVVKVLGGAP